MRVVKRDGTYEPCSFDKITQRIEKLCWDLPIDPLLVTQRVVTGLVDGMPTSKIDEHAADTAAFMAPQHHAYGALAGRIAVSNLQKNTRPSFSQTMVRLHEKNDRRLFSERFLSACEMHASVFDAAISHDRDFEFDYFAFKTLERSYLLRVGNEIAERPQHMWMRVAVGIHFEDSDAALETYEMLSQRKFTHATPTLFNAGLRKPQMSSCFLLQIREDSVDGIYDTLKQCALISKTAGGIGLAAHNVRATDAPILGTNGKSNGIVPMLRVFDATARYIDQGGGKRKGSVAVYLEPWHADVEDFLRMKRNQGKEDMKARDLFYGLWIPDLFMRRMVDDGMWTLFSPDRAPGLHLVWGEAFDALYEKYEKEGRGARRIRAQDLWRQISATQIETGTPYIMFKDAANRTSNHQHLGTIQCSNLCTEIIQYTNEDEVAVCNLASISVSSFAREGEPYDFEGLAHAARVLTRNLNKIIDNNYYPVPEAKRSNMRHRPIGVGVQGLADAFACMGWEFDGPQARDLNRKIFETIYYACLDASCALAERDGTYESYVGSPFSKGKLQMDMGWKTECALDWTLLRERIAKHGTRNSLLTTVMPTASTSQILGNNECVEAFTSNLYARKTLAGNFFVVNKWLVRDLERLGLWNKTMQDKIIASEGSVQGMQEIPERLRRVYRTAYEIPQRSVVEMAAERAPFIDQSQSLNIYMQDASFRKFTSLHHTIWKLGLIGSYYLRCSAIAKPIAFTVSAAKDECLMCSA